MKPLDTDMILKNSESHELNLLEDVERLFCCFFFLKVFNDVLTIFSMHHVANFTINSLGC